MSLKRTLMAATAAAMTLTASAEAAQVLRFAEFGPNRGWRADVQAWLAEEIEARSNGELKLNTSFGGSLIKARDVLDGVGDGLADLGTIVGVYTPKKLGNYRVGDIPTGNDDAYVGLMAMYDLANESDAIKAEFDRENVVYIGNFTSSTVLLACKEPVTKLSDLDGLKVRANPPHADVFRDAGAVIVAMPFPEVYQSLDKGVIDCAQTYWTAIYAYKHHEVAKHITTLNWSQNMSFGVVMNRDVFNDLTPEQQEMMRGIGRDLTVLSAKLTIESTASLKDAIGQDPGVTIHTLEPASQAELIEAGLATAKDFDGEQAVLDAYLSLVKTYAGELAEKGYPWAE